MNIKTLLEAELWNSIEKNYSVNNYTGAIDDAIFYIRDIIREKSNLEIDGEDLINQAFSEKNPKIQLSKLRTKHDKNIQNGMRESLIGIWKLIRNTRSHEKHEDGNLDALSIILYINYLSKIIGKAKSSFFVDDFIKEVYDKHFEQTEEYAKLLVGEIPPKQLEDTFFHLYKRMGENIYEDDGYDSPWEIDSGNGENHRKLTSLKLVALELFKKLDKDKENILQKILDDFRLLDVGNEFFWKLYIIIEEWNILDVRIKLRIRKMILDRFSYNSEYTIYQRKIFLEGWKYFDDDTKIKIKDLYVYKSSDYYIDHEELKYKENRVPKENKLPPLLVEIIDADNIPF